MNSLVSLVPAASVSFSSTIDLSDPETVGLVRALIKLEWSQFLATAEYWLAQPECVAWVDIL